jgi:hypothetical protein
MRKKFIGLCLIVGALGALAQASPSGVIADVRSTEDSPQKTLVGAWFIDVHPTLIPAFVSLGTFSIDGTLTNISSVSLGTPPESPGYGVWVRTGRRTYASTFQTIMGDGAGGLGGTQKVRATATLGSGGDRLTGVFQVDVFDPSGALIVSDTGTVEGRRIKVEALP